MWYRIAKNLLNRHASIVGRNDEMELREASRVLTDPEQTWHMTGNTYTHPIVDPNPDSPMNQLGFGDNAWGAGHYTSQNPQVLQGYKESLRNRGDNAIARKYRLPRGTRVLDASSIPAVEARNLLLFLRGKHGYDSLSPDVYRDRPTYTLDEVLSDANIDSDKANHLLKKCGYDAIEYEPFQHHGNNETNDKSVGKKNILILNDQIINNPREFTRSRMRPDTGSLAPQNTSRDLYLKALESNALPPNMIPSSLVHDPEMGDKVRNVVLKKFMEGEVPFRELPEWAKQDERLIEFGLNYDYIGPDDIPDNLRQNETLMHNLYEKGLVPYWALPETPWRREPDIIRRDNNPESYDWDNWDNWNSTKQNEIGTIEKSDTAGRSLSTT